LLHTRAICLHDIRDMFCDAFAYTKSKHIRNMRTYELIKSIQFMLLIYKKTRKMKINVGYGKGTKCRNNLAYESGGMISIDKHCGIHNQILNRYN